MPHSCVQVLDVDRSDGSSSSSSSSRPAGAHQGVGRGIFLTVGIHRAADAPQNANLFLRQFPENVCRRCLSLAKVGFARVENSHFVPVPVPPPPPSEKYPSAQRSVKAGETVLIDEPVLIYGGCPLASTETTAVFRCKGMTAVPCPKPLFLSEPDLTPRVRLAVDEGNKRHTCANCFRMPGGTGMELPHR